VRCNAVEALGVICAAEAVPRLVSLSMTGECSFVRDDAALSLARIGPQAESALPLLKKALADGIPYVRGNAQLALASGSRL
jgi:HEAT repeat protein